MPATSVTENAGQGTDTVGSSVSFALGANVENLGLTGSANISGTGNDLANILVGNTGNNLLTGGGGTTAAVGADDDAGRHRQRHLLRRQCRRRRHRERRRRAPTRSQAASRSPSATMSRTWC